MEMYRQGDVLLVKTDEEIPEDAEKVSPENGKVILAHGEVTGHMHAVSSRHAKLYQAGQTALLEVSKQAKLTHQEHSTIPLSEGTYRVYRQREYTPEAIRPVLD